MTESVFAHCDDLGPEKIIHIHEPGAGLKAILVVDNTAAGPSIGGVRMAPDVSLEECARLARAMTYKNAAAGLPHGGGKAVIFADPATPRAEKERLLRCFATAIGPIRDYIAGPDMGTNETSMAWLHDEIGRAVGLPREIGGIPLDEIGATGSGLVAATEVAGARIGLDIQGARVAVQGFGSVGKHVARLLAAKGAVVVAAADSRGTLADPEGLDVTKLIELKNQGHCLVDAAFGKKLDREAIVGIDCDIWIPAARPDVIREDNVDKVRARLIVQGANIGVTREAEIILHQRGTLCVPDFVGNAGGVICAAIEYQGGTENEALGIIDEKIRSNVAEVLDKANRDKVAPRIAAISLSEERVRTAMQIRRWHS